MKVILFSWIIINIVIMSTLPTGINRVSATPVKIPMTFFTEVGRKKKKKKTITIHKKLQKTLNS